MYLQQKFSIISRMIEEGNFKPHICDDVKGMLYLYEASYFAVEGESVLDDARDFTTKNLEKYTKQCCNNVDYLSKLVSHALEVPLAWRVPKLEAYWFIHAYESQNDKEHILLQLAKLDFNMIQAIYQQELKESIRWWRSTKLAEKLSFARDWLVEIYLYAATTIFEPQFTYSRRKLTELGQLFTTLDDMYDVYGGLDELELFTDAIERWDINAMDQFPDYMKLYFLALCSSINETAYDILRDKGFNIIPYYKKLLSDYCKACLLEAKWYHDGYQPTLQEYLENAWISAPTSAMLVYVYYCAENPINKELAECREKYPNTLRWLSIIMRLANDLGTSVGEIRRGDVPKSIQCYMHETGASEEEARDYIRNLLIQMWKNVNRDQFSDSLLSQILIESGVDMIRLTLSIYLDAEDYDSVLEKSTDAAMSLFLQPIP